MQRLSEIEKQQKQNEILESHKKMLQAINISDFTLEKDFSLIKYKDYEIALVDDNILVMKNGQRLSFEDIYLPKVEIDEKIHDIINILENYRVEKNMSMLLTTKERFEKDILK